MRLQNISSAASCLQLVLHDVECFLLQMIIMLVKIIFCTNIAKVNFALGSNQQLLYY